MVRKAFRVARREASRILVELQRMSQSLEGMVRGNAVKAYWYVTVTNFGDLITPLLLRQYDFTPVHYPIDEADVLAAGSILQSAPADYSGHILGSGLIEDTRRTFKDATIWAVRGKLTRDRINAPEDAVLGDPGLLAMKLLKRRMQRRYALGIVPHYVDANDPRVSQIARRYEDDVLVIDVMQNPLVVLEAIDSCDKVLSSSLHGLVAADSLGIPNAWIQLSDDVVGGGFKFHDYASAFDETIVPIELRGDEPLSALLKYPQPPSKRIAAVKQKLDKSFLSLRSYLASV